jgi:uncharacterized membrane protein
MSWLGQELDPDVQRRRLARKKEEGRALAMQQPLTTEQAYRLFGTFLGLIPPLAIFERTLAKAHGDEAFWYALICVIMNMICCLVGRWFGAYLGRWVGDPRRCSRAGFVFVVFILAVSWSVVTGSAGGVLVFGIGALFGVFYAVPVAFAGFPAFAILHRLISRGGMIEARHAWPLAFGIPLTIAALISSPWLK